MLNFIDSIIFAFKEILNFQTMRLALLVGVVVNFVWIIIAYLFWDSIIAFSGYFLDAIPFSIIRSNGAWMLSTFLWFQLVLITFALVFAFLGNLILNSVSKEKYGSFSIIVALGSAFFWGIVWFFESDYIYAQSLKLLTWLPFETIEKGLSYLIGIYFIYSAIIVTMIFVTSALSYTFLTSVKEKYFPYDNFVEDNEIKTIRYTLKDTSIFVVASTILFPLFFIPVVNFLVQILLWVWLVKDTFVYDTASLLMQEIDKEKLKEHRGAFWGISALVALFNFVPVFNIFGPFFGQLAMFYYLKKSLHS